MNRRIIFFWFSLIFFTVIARAEENGEGAASPQIPLACEPAKLSGEAVAGEGIIMELKVALKNVSGTQIRWEIKSSPKWIQAEIEKGKLDAGEKLEMPLLAETADMPVGTVEDKIVFAVPGSFFQTEIPVSIRIRPPPPPPVQTAAITSKPLPIPIVSVKHPPAFGLRLSYMLPGKGETKDYGDAPVFGLMYRILPVENRFGFEIGVNYGELKSDKYKTSSTIITGQVSTLYFVTQSRSIYAVAGLQLLNEKYTDDLNKETSSSSSPLVDVGLGVILFGGRVDLRGAYSYITSTDNVGSIASVSASYLF